MKTRVLLQVAVPVPSLDRLTYYVPESRPCPVVGARVRVSVGSRVLVGCVVGVADETDRSATDPPPESLKPILEILDEEPFVPPHVVQLASWAAEYYMAGLGETIAVALPPMAGRAEAHRFVRVAELTPRGREEAERVANRGSAAGSAAGAPAGTLGGHQLAAMKRLRDASGPVSMQALAELGIPAHSLERLAARGYALVSRERLERDPFESPVHGESAQRLGDRANAEGLPLTDEQTAVVSALTTLVDSCALHVALLHGVTGSGKTEVYLRLTAHVLEQGRRALILVPEIALTPALAALVRSRFGARVAIQHSGLSDGERHDQWQRIRRGEVDIVVGTRSAVFAPLADTGLIIVDEEHDSSYKQDESPRYHGRNVALIRGQQERALVVLGSATPSLESYEHVRAKRYTLAALPHRVLDRPLASVRIVDMREVYAAEGPDVVVSPALRDALAARVAAGEQAIVLLNRRGFSTAIFCRQCGGTFECPNCSVSLTVHGSREGKRRARCHYCNYSMAVTARCPVCAAPYLEQIGIGTERVEEEVRRLLPSARVARVDRDIMTKRGALPALLESFAAGELDVLVGTQIIAKGHDFPRVTLVGVISADVGLGVADFRAAERTFQLLTQVVGRAGRGDRPGEAIVQTLYPGHYSIELASRQDYAAFFAREQQYRAAMHYPPVVSLVNVVVRGRTMAGALGEASALAEHVRKAAGTSSGIHVLGPAPAPLARIRGEHRAQFFLKGTARPRMRELLRDALAKNPALRRRVRIDVDPVSML